MQRIVWQVHPLGKHGQTEVCDCVNSIHHACVGPLPCLSVGVVVMDVLKVVQQLRDLAADPQNRATIVRDQGCLPGLVIFLDNDNPDVVLTALEALFYLAQVPSNRPLMKNEMGLLISVRRIINRQHSPHELKSSAQKVHDLLIPPSGSGRPSSHSRHGASRSNSFLGSSNRRAKTIILQVEGLNDEVRAPPRHTYFRGVVSLWLSRNFQYATYAVSELWLCITS
jgi:hypothetical protein